MKLYHIDRFGTLNVGQTINLIKNISFENLISNENINDIMKKYYCDGISHHGIHYLLNNELYNNNVMPLSNVMDIIFEYERLLNYSDKLSRYQAFYAFDKNGVIEFIKNNSLSNSFYKIYEVESNYYEKHNMTLISGAFHYNIASMAKLYWEDKSDPYNRLVLNEYLLKFPIKVVKEVNLNQLED
jgi:hypothetical protein